MRAEDAPALSAPPDPADPETTEGARFARLRLRLLAGPPQAGSQKRHTVDFLRTRESVCGVGSLRHNTRRREHRSSRSSTIITSNRSIDEWLAQRAELGARGSGRRLGAQGRRGNHDRRDGTERCAESSRPLHEAISLD